MPTAQPTAHPQLTPTRTALTEAIEHIDTLLSQRLPNQTELAEAYSIAHYHLTTLQHKSNLLLELPE
jgi:hypothetical protein